MVRTVPNGAEAGEQPELVGDAQRQLETGVNRSGQDTISAVNLNGHTTNDWPEYAELQEHVQEADYGTTGTELCAVNSGERY